MERPIKVAIAGSGYGRKVALLVYAELEEFEPVARVRAVSCLRYDRIGLFGALA
jgi:hypothetical protein